MNLKMWNATSISVGGRCAVYEYMNMNISGPVSCERDFILHSAELNKACRATCRLCKPKQTVFDDF